MAQKKKITEQHESDYCFMRRCADKMNLPWQSIVSNKTYVDIMQEARYSNMSVNEAVNFFREILSEKKDVVKKPQVKTPGQSMDISKRNKEFPTPPCDIDRN